MLYTHGLNTTNKSRVCAPRPDPAAGREPLEATGAHDSRATSMAKKKAGKGSAKQEAKDLKKKKQEEKASKAAKKKSGKVLYVVWTICWWRTCYV